MPEKTFLPYQYEPEALDLKLHAVYLDEHPIEIEECVDTEHHQVALNVRNLWAKARFEVEVIDPNEELPRLIGPEENISDALNLILAVRGTKGRFRKGVALQSASGNRWQGDFEILRERHRGSVGVQVIALRARDASGGEGIAQRAGERVAGSGNWRFYIDEKPIMPGGAIDGEWCVFAEHTDPEVSSRQDCAWYLDLQNAERPRLLLNEGIEHLKPALESTAISGIRANVREAISHSILQPVLLSLGQFAVERNLELGFAALEGWQKGVLVALARQIKGLSEDAKIEDWFNAWTAEDYAVVLADMTAAIQRLLGMPERVSKLVASLERDNG